MVSRRITQGDSDMDRRRSRRTTRTRPVVGGERRFEASAVPMTGRLERAPAPSRRRAAKTRKTVHLPPLQVRLPRIRIRIRTNRVQVMTLVLLCGVIAGLYQLGNNDLFYVSAIDVQGNAIVPQAEIERAAGVTFWNIFFIDPRAVETALGKLPEIKYSRASVAVPNQVAIEVEERKPYYVWQSGGKEYWVDQDGLAMQLRRRMNLPVILDADAREVTVGQTVRQEAIEAANALQLVWPAGPRAYEWSAAHGLAIMDEHGWKVYFGNARQMQDKVTALRTVTQLITQANRKVTYIDLGNGLPYFQEVAPSPTPKKP